MAGYVPNNEFQRGNLLFCYFLKKNAEQAHQLLVEAYGGHALSRRQCFEWFKKFKAGQYELQNQPRGRPPKKFEDEELETLLEENCAQSQEELAQQLSVTRQAISKRLTALGKILKFGKWVPHELTEIHQEQRRTTCKMLIARHDRKSFLHRIVTGDEKWIFFENPKRTRGWVNRGAVPSTSRQNRFGKKTMLCLFWDQKGLVHFELLQPGETVNQDRYQQQMRDLTAALLEKRPEWHERHEGKILLHDNAPAHRTTATKEVLAELGWEILPHPPYSPDLAPSDYHVFASMGHALSKQRFTNYEEVREWLENWFGTKPEDFFRRGIRKLPERWEACVASEGQYFE